MMLQCEREPDNPYDEFAVRLRAPSAAEMESVIGSLTRDPPRVQHVRDVCGRVVGRVPRGISKIISEGLRDGALHRAVCFYRGGFLHRGPVRGGGPQLKAVYCLYLSRGPGNRRNDPQRLIDLADKIRPFLDDEFDIYL